MNKANKSVETFDLSLFDFDDLTDGSSAKSGLSSSIFSDTQTLHKYPSPSYEPIINNILQISPDEFLQTLEQLNHEGKEESTMITNDEKSRCKEDQAIPSKISPLIRKDMQPLASFGDFAIRNKGQRQLSLRESVPADVSFTIKNASSSCSKP